MVSGGLRVWSHWLAWPGAVAVVRGVCGGRGGPNGPGGGNNASTMKRGGILAIGKDHILTIVLATLANIMHYA